MKRYTEGIVSYWKFDEGSGTKVDDSVGTNQGTNNNATWTIGQINGALSFDGIDDYVKTLRNGFDPNKGSIEMWIKPADFSSYYGLWTIYNGDGSRLRVYLIWGRLYLTGSGAGNNILISNLTGSGGEWHHIVTTYDFVNNDYRFYQNGNLIGVSSYGRRAMTSLPSEIYIGIGKDQNDDDNDGSALDYPFDGIIDEVSLYNRVLTATEVQQHHSDGLKGSGYCNDPPVAEAGGNQDVHTGDLVQLDGSASTDDNTPSASLLYTWSFTSRPDGSETALIDADTATPSFTADLPGTYVVSLVVTDEGGLSSDPDEVSIFSLNSPPKADAGPDKTVQATFADGSEYVILDGTGSSDPDQDPLIYEWTEGGENIATGETASVVLTFGEHLITLTVSDGYKSASDSVLITVDASPAGTSEIIEDLVTSSAIDPWDAGNLKDFLANAEEQIAAGDNDSAIKDLDKFKKEVDKLQNQGKILKDTAELLLGAADATINKLAGRFY